MPRALHRFFRTRAFDRLFATCLLYFVTRLHQEALQAALLKAQRLKLTHLKSSVVETRLTELKARAICHLSDVATEYAALILRESRPARTRSDAKFFEALLAALALCLIDAANGKHRLEIEIELGRLFRTPAFNGPARLARGPAPRDALPLAELAARLGNPGDRAALLRRPCGRPRADAAAPSTVIGARLTAQGQPRGVGKIPARDFVDQFAADTIDPSRDTFAAAFFTDETMPARRPDCHIHRLGHPSHTKTGRPSSGQYSLAPLQHETDVLPSLQPWLSAATGTAAAVTSPPGAGPPFPSYTVHVSERGMADNEVTLEMARLYRSIQQANILSTSGDV